MTIKKKKYGELHIFIDESGMLNKTPDEDNTCLVGGVLCWGKYDDLDKELKEMLLASLRYVYGTDTLENLHYHNNEDPEYKTEKYWKRKNDLLNRIKDKISTFNSNEDCVCLLQGFSIEHREDINPGGPTLVAEEKIDNRYLYMLSGLLEHLLYVTSETGRTLLPNAKIHVYVASRNMVEDLENNPQKRELKIKQYNYLGYRVTLWKDVDGKDKLTISQSLTKNDLRELLRAIQQRWNTVLSSSYEIMPEDIISINYEGKGLSKACYYLADLYLGQKRKQIDDQKRKQIDDQKRKQIKDSPTAPLLAPEYLHTYYEPAFYELNECSKHAANEGYGYFEDLLWRNPSIVSCPLFADFKKEYASKVSLSRIHLILERIRQEIDNSSVSTIFTKAKEVRAQMVDIMESNPKLNNARSQLLSDWIDLAIANHSGNIIAGNNVWSRYEQHQQLLSYLEPEIQLHFHIEILLRRVVNLMDSFRYGEARQLLPDVVKKLELVQQFYSENKIIEGADNWPSLGYCCSSLGQIAAFTATSPKESHDAEQFFRKALIQYNPDRQAADIERTWIYLGHVACDASKYDLPFAQQLWNEVSKNLSLSFDKNNIEICLNDEQQSRYIIHLLLKGIYSFGTNADFTTLLSVWQKGSPISQTIQTMVADPTLHTHPCGLICQILGMLYERLYEETNNEPDMNKAKIWYGNARKLMQQGDDGVIVLLSIIAQMRNAIMLAKTNNNASAQSNMSTLFEDAQTLLICNFNEAAWKENKNSEDSGFFGSRITKNSSFQDKIQAIIDSIRFNYW